MGWLALVVVVLVIAAVAFKKLPALHNAVSAEDFPYEKTTALFTPAERSFLGVIDQMLGAQYRIMGKVRIADVVKVAPIKDRKRWQRAFNRISAKHFDFVLCDKQTLAPIAVVELDDKSHNAAQRRERDNFIANVCQAASLRLLRMPARQAYTQSDVQRLIVSPLEALQQDAAHQAVRRHDEAHQSGNRASAAKQGASPSCPKCASPMLLRRVKKGARIGETLWGCSHYPSCRGYLPTRTADPAY